MPEDYQAIHDWFDATKAFLPDVRHRALRHHAEGIFLCEEIFGTTITLSTCGRCGSPHPHKIREDAQAGVEAHAFKEKKIPVRWVGEQHVREDMGFIPTAAQWLEQVVIQPWMNRSRKLSRELEESDGRRVGDVPSVNIEAALRFRAESPPVDFDASSVEADPMAAQRKGV